MFADQGLRMWRASFSIVHDYTLSFIEGLTEGFELQDLDSDHISDSRASQDNVFTLASHEGQTCWWLAPAAMASLLAGIQWFLDRSTPV